MMPAASFLAIIFIGVFMSICLGKTYGPITKSEFIRQYNRTISKRPSEHNTNITCNACKRYVNATKNTRRVIIDPITVVPVFQEIPPAKKVQLQVQPQLQPQVQPAPEPIQDKPTRYLRNGYYSQPILKTYLRGSPLVQNLAAYNPPDRYCYSIMSSIKSIVGI